MKDAKHTPGKIGRLGSFLWQMDANNGYDPEYALRAARLFEAAPDLLEALQAIEFALGMPGVSSSEVLDENSPIRDGIRAAIAKAGGA